MAISRGKLFLWIVLALLVCVLIGYVWGRSGRGELQTAADEIRQQLDIAEARGEILDGRVSLYNNNFGDASRHFETAKAPLQRVKQRYQEDSKREAAAVTKSFFGTLATMLIAEGKLDPAANNKAGQALEAIRAASSGR